MKFLLWLWQLPQNLIGFIWTRFCKETKIICKTKVYFLPCFDSGITLGQYIILDPINEHLGVNYLIETVRHEKGHRIQSEKLGWFYLLIVGLPSLFNNIYDRFFHKKWSIEKRLEWYYSRYPEKQADKLGGVIR